MGNTVDIDPHGMKSALNQLKLALPDFLEISRIKAQLKREHYNALIDSGFHKDEAIIIVSNWNPLEA